MTLKQRAGRGEGNPQNHGASKPIGQRENMGLENVPRCRHVKVNGTQCGSPALRRRRYCFFHDRAQEQHARIMGDQFKQARFVVPLLEDANAVQLALMQVMQLLGSGQMEPKIAGLMQIGRASCRERV